MLRSDLSEQLETEIIKLKQDTTKRREKQTCMHGMIFQLYLKAMLFEIERGHYTFAKSLIKIHLFYCVMLYFYMKS